jgi:hypothetical protein
MKNIAALCVALLLAACAAYDGFTLRPGASTEAEVRGVMGQPAMEFTQPDGSRKLVFPRGPLGVQTFMAVIGPDGVLRGIEKVLMEENFYRIQPGMTRDEILRMIGPPGETMHFAGTDTTAWDYRFMDLWGYQAIFSVIFNREGVVVSKFTRRIERDKGR